jgi:hypothetical protein
MAPQTDTYSSHHLDALISRMDQFLSPFTLSILSSALKSSQKNANIEKKVDNFIKEAVKKAFTQPDQFEEIADWHHPLMSVNTSGFGKDANTRNPVQAELERHLRDVLLKYGFDKQIIDRVVNSADNQLTSIMSENSRGRLSQKILSFCANPQLFEQKDWNRNTLIALSSYAMLKVMEIIEEAPPQCMDALLSGALHDPQLLQQRKRVAEVFAALCLNALLNNHPIPRGTIEAIFSTPPSMWAQGVFYFKGFSKLTSISSASAKMVQEILHTAIAHEASGAQSLAFNLSDSLGIDLDQADALVAELEKSGGGSEFDLQKQIISIQQSKSS